MNTVKQFTGQILDSTGLYYYNARYYDPTIGRFISGDNLVSEPFNPQDLNRYSYCLDNPMKYTDPTGHDMVITVGGVNPDGDTWYNICDGQGVLLATATGMDQLAQEMAACQAESQNIYLPLGQGAADFFAATGQPSAAEQTNGTQSTPTPTTSSAPSTPTTSSAPSTVAQSSFPVATSSPYTQANSAEQKSIDLSPSVSNQDTVFGIPLEKFGGIVLEALLDVPLLIAVAGGLVTGTLPLMVLPIIAYESAVAPFHALALYMFLSK